MGKRALLRRHGTSEPLVPSKAIDKEGHPLSNITFLLPLSATGMQDKGACASGRAQSVPARDVNPVQGLSGGWGPLRPTIVPVPGQEEPYLVTSPYGSLWLTLKATKVLALAPA